MRKFAAVFLSSCTLVLLAGCPKPSSVPSSDPSGVCGGIRGLTCPDGQYCDYDIGNCRPPDWQGTCKSKPEVCTEDYRPVCGCDGKTYGNACAAAQAGVSVELEGECSQLLD